MDEPTKTVVLHRTEPTRLQCMLLQLSDKVRIILFSYFIELGMMLVAMFFKCVFVRFC